MDLWPLMVGVFYFRRYQAGVSPISAQKTNGVHPFKNAQNSTFRKNDRYRVHPLDKREGRENKCRVLVQRQGQ